MKKKEIELDNQEYIQSQYSNSPTIKKLLYYFSQRILPDTDIETLYRNIIDIDTAKGIGLDYWGRIVGVQREIFTDDTTANTAILGFNGSELNPFSQGVFVTLDDLITGERVIAALDDEQFRRLILFKALINISSTDMSSVNKISNILFNNNNLIITNIINEDILTNGDKYNKNPMEVRVSWLSLLITNVEKELLTKYLNLLIPAGVEYFITYINSEDVFGFKGSELNPFNQGVFTTVKENEGRDL